MQLKCKHCASAIQAANINMERMVAACASCNAVFSFEDQFEAPAKARRENVPMPKGIQIQHLGNALEITRRWFSPKIFFLAFFALLWNGFMVMWFGIAITHKQGTMAAFGTLHGLLGLGLIYQVLCGFLNSTIIRVDGGMLSIKHAPLPYMGTRQMASQDIAQLYCKERMHRHKHSQSWSFELHASLRSGKQVKLLKGLEEADQALFLEQELERFLGIKDVHVEGSML